jgi:hypothetical protein
MSLLVLSLVDTADIHSIYKCDVGDEFTSLIAWLTSKSIVFVKDQQEATKQGTYCSRIDDSKYLYFQALDTGVEGEVFYVTIGYLVYIVAM